MHPWSTKAFYCRHEKVQLILPSKTLWSIVSLKPLPILISTSSHNLFHHVNGSYPSCESCLKVVDNFLLSLYFFETNRHSPRQALKILTSCLFVLFGHGLGFMPTCKDLLLCLDLFILLSFVLFLFLFLSLLNWKLNPCMEHGMNGTNCLSPRVAGSVFNQEGNIMRSWLARIKQWQTKVFIMVREVIECKVVAERKWHACVATRVIMSHY